MFTKVRRWYGAHRLTLIVMFMVAIVVAGFLRMEAIQNQRDDDLSQRRTDRIAQDEDTCERIAVITIAARNQVNLLVDTSLREAAKSKDLTDAQKAHNKVLAEKYRADSLALTPPFDCPSKTFAQIEKEHLSSKEK